ncbi:hypothetical protein Moror_10568 [Moniliophthora roreri MCA 2997]|uniref:Uncharacterized protein n=1 Tax=Moniliophthora roreri (strain MCA 2997) TaxID=1381753 RepID=V2YJ69_MONRO|nr:hypothetical protein Moror_10568 [Moniliophthora roreri MCA 2997]
MFSGSKGFTIHGGDFYNAGDQNNYEVHGNLNVYHNKGISRSLDDPNATLNACYDSEQRFPHPIAILALVHGSSRS